METLLYCLNILKIEKDNEIYRNALELVQKDRLDSANVSNKWISAMKTIANAYSSLTSYVFTQSQLSDFLTLSAKGIEDKRMSSGIIDNLIFKIYRDIMENYENFSDILKLNYPGIIVDIISIINQRMDTKGIKINLVDIERYYQSRKQQQGTMTKEREEQITVASASASTTAAAAIDKDEILLSLYSKNDLVESLSQITNRERKEIQESLAKLQGSDLKRISDLCRNSSRLQQYTKLITKKEEGSQEQFKKEIQKELGRKLRSHQLGRAANSIIRARTYIENILDNKFIPDASHGINHVKHNLEYGYQLMNLIERTRRRQRIQ
jgi:hypothetical protein